MTDQTSPSDMVSFGTCEECGYYPVQFIVQGDKVIVQHLKWPNQPPEASAPVVALGRGLVGVAEGWFNSKRALLFTTGGTGKIGEVCDANVRLVEQSELLAVLTFDNVECLDVIVDKLTSIRTDLASPGTLADKLAAAVALAEQP